MPKKRPHRRPAPRLAAERLEDRVTPAVVPFALPQPVLSGVGYPYTVTAADLNGDGTPDVLASATDGSEISWAANLGNGVFGPKQVVDPGTPGGFVTNSYAVDFDGDGDLDVMAAGDDILRVHLNAGGGAFGSTVTVAAAGTFRAAFAGDLDGDGDKDVATITNADGQARWYRNDGGSFALAQTVTTGADGARAMTALDADGDGDTDLVVGSNVVNKVGLFLNDGAGVFGPESVVTTDVSGLRNLYAADLDADGQTDLVSVAYGSSEVAWYKNVGGAFTKAVISDQPGGYFAAAVGDVDGDGDPDVVAAGFDNSSLAWFANDGAGAFGPRQFISAVTGGGGLLAVGAADVDGDGDLDVVSSDTTDPYKVSWFENRTGQFATAVVSPASGSYLAGQSIDVKVHFGVPVTVTGTPEIDLRVGGQTVAARYVAGSGTPGLTFRYVVTAADVDADGVTLVSAAVRPAGGTLTDPAGAPVNLSLPAADLGGVTVNGSAPLVTSITRLDPGVTNARSVRFRVRFGEPVTGVTAADFAPSGTLANATVTGVTGAGAEYTVTVSTGSGSGGLGLAVLNDGSVADGAGNKLGIGFAGGEVYTLQRRPARTVGAFYQSGHGDIGVGFEGGDWNLHVHSDGLGESAPDGVLIVGGADALRATPAGPQWAFLGAGATSYYFPETGSIAGVPDLGVSGEEIPAGTFASYANADPRVNATGAWVGVRLVGLRGPAGGNFSVYTSGDAGPTVWMATSDGVGATDVLYTPQGSHNHYNFAFSTPGVYQIDVVASGYRDANGNGTFDPGVDPYSESGVTTYYFSIDPAGGPTPLALPADPLPPAAPPVAVPFARPRVVGGGLNGVSSATPADLDGDGDPDLVVGAYGAGRMSWFENLGGGAFGPERVIDGIDSVWYAVPGDLDGDGDLDVVAAGYSGVFSWYANDGAGNFGPARVIDTDTSTPVVGLVDFDGDGRLDILAAPDFGTDVRLYRGLAGGGFGGRETLVGGIQNSIGLQAADFDGDGDIDIAYGEYQTDTLHVYLNQGGGVLGPRVTVAGGDGPGVMGYADFDGDGRGDLLEVQFAGDGLAWYPNNGDGTFGPRRALPGVPGGPYAVHAADLDGDGDVDIASGTFGSNSNLVWLPNLGGGEFGPALVVTRGGGQVSSVTSADFDGDGDRDVVAASYSLGQVLFFENRLGQFATEVVAPTPRTYLAGQSLDVVVHFGVPVAVTGSPSVTLVVGGRAVQAVYVSGAGTPALTFRYVVNAADLDADGVVLGSAVRLNGGSITGPVGPVGLSLPGADLSGVRVNGSAPVVRSVTRLDATPTNAGTVRFRVVFSEDVTGVDAADFGLATGLAGASVTGVAGSGAEYVVTVSTGTGTGTVGLSVPVGASVADAAGNALGDGFAGGEVYTLNRRPEQTIDEYYTEGHGDVGIGYADGAWDLHIHNDDGEFAPNELLIYGGPDGLRDTPAGLEFAFIGAAPGAQSYYFPQNGSILTVPELGVGGEAIASGTFASYLNADPRVNASGAWVRLQLVGLRAPAGAHFSLYSSGDAGPTVWMATSDGITAADSLFILAGSHNHFNFAFTLPGVYEVDVVASGFLDLNGNGTYDEGVDRYTESGVVTYYFAIDLPGGPRPYTVAADPLPPAPPVPPVPPVPPSPPDVPPPFVPPVDPPGVPPVTPPVVPPVVPVVPPVTPPAVTPPAVPSVVRLSAVGAGVGGGPRVRVFNPDGSLRFDFFAYDESFRGGVTVATGDVTGDGVDDIVTGAGFGGGPHVRVFDGRTGADLGSFFAFDAALRGGVHLAVADLDGDGKAEIIAGAGAGGGPHVRVFTAAGGLVREWFAGDPDSRGGVTVAAGDLDGDGVADVVTGAGAGSAPEVRTYDGRTGAQGLDMMAYSPDFTGGVYVAAGDLDGDGRAEVVTGAGPGGGPHVRAFDGRSGADRGGLMAYESDFTGGVRVAAREGGLLVGPGAGGRAVKRFAGLPLAAAGTVEAFEPGFSGGVFVG